MSTVEILIRPEQFVDHFYRDLIANAEPLGLNYVGTYDEKLIPAYPAVVVSAGPMEKELHATHTFLYTNRVFFYIQHAILTMEHRRRNQEDLELATRVSNFIERNKTLGETITFGYVEFEAPGVMVPGSDKGNAVVGTRMTYHAISEGRF